MKPLGSTDFLLGKKLMQVCIGRYQIQLKFSDELMIDAGNGVNYFDGNRDWSWSHRNGTDPFSMNGVIEMRITRAKQMGPGDLELEFENGQKVTITRSKKDDGESYIVNSKEHYYVA